MQTTGSCPRPLKSGLTLCVSTQPVRLLLGYCRIIAADGSLLDERKPHRISSEPYLEFLRGNYIWCPASVIYRRSTFDSVNGI